MQDIVTRHATEADAPEILKIVKLSFKMYADALNDPRITVDGLKESLAQTLSDISNKNVYVAEVDGSIAGSIRWEKLTDEVAYIFRFGVHPDINNTGVGSALLDYCEDQIVNARCKAITLHTNSRYYKLARYYYGKGFFVHSTSDSKGYIRALFVRELSGAPVDISAAFSK